MREESRRWRGWTGAAASGMLAAAVVAAGCQQAVQNNEAGAIGNVRAVVSAQFTYAALCGNSYAPTLQALADAGHLAGGLISEAQPVRNGYRYTMSAVRGDGASTCGDFYKEFEVRAAPESPGRTGVRYFRAGSDGSVRAATDAGFSDEQPLP